MAYDAWKADDEFYSAHELAAMQPANDVLRLKHPRYMLEVNYDRWLGLTEARLSLMTVPREGWRQLDYAIVNGDDEQVDDDGYRDAPEVSDYPRSIWPGVRVLLARRSVRRMREARRAARGLFT